MEGYRYALSLCVDFTCRTLHAAANLCSPGLAGIIGPAAAHAVVAGHACGFLLLVGLRLLTKGALPDTTWGLRTSFCIYFAVTAALVLAALVVYVKMVRPVVLAASCDMAVADLEGGDLLDGCKPAMKTQPG
jgi:hypothetical protein